jgi:hypothetical protein
VFDQRVGHSARSLQDSVVTQPTHDQEKDVLRHLLVMVVHHGAIRGFQNLAAFALDRDPVAGSAPEVFQTHYATLHVAIERADHPSGRVATREIKMVPADRAADQPKVTR